MKSAKCPSSITNKTLLLRHQGVKLVRQWPNTELKFPKGTSLHTESFITTLKKLFSHHAYQARIVLLCKFMGLKLYHGVCFNPVEFVSKMFLLKFSLLTTVSLNWGNSGDLFQLQWCYPEPMRSAVKQQLFRLLLPIMKKTKYLINAEKLFTRGHMRRPIRRQKRYEYCSRGFLSQGFQLLKINSKKPLYLS